MHTLYLATLTLIALLLTGCGQQEATATAPATADQAAAASPSLPPDLLSDVIEDEPVGPLTAKAEAAAGDPIVLTGHIGGRANPFVDGRAMFTLIDLSLPVCVDACPTPWDACCETPEDITAASATIQVVGPDEKPLRVGLKGPDRLQPGQKVVIAGQVAQKDDYTFVVNAERIAVTPTP